MQRIELTGDGRRLDVLLAESSGLTRSRIASLMEDGCVTVDGKPERKAGAKAKAGQQIVLEIPDPKPAIPQAEDIPLTILYEDKDLAVVVKPCGMVVHPAAGNEDGTLVNALLHHLDSLGGIGGELRPGIVHRLDKDTSGLIVIAKNDAAHVSLAEQIKEKTAKRIYRAVLIGNLKEDTVTVDACIGRHRTDRKKMAVVPDGRSAQTVFNVLERFGDYTYVECELKTGRTHQIRVHAKYIGHPVLGDPVYSSGKSPFRLEGQLLHACRLNLKHPSTGEDMEFTAPLPGYFEDVLCKLRK